MNPSNSKLASRCSPLVVTSILLIAACLRVPITALGPLLGAVRDTFALDASEAGLLTTLPLLAFAVVSPLAAPMASRFGLERALLASMIVLAAGILLRSEGSSWALYSGTCVLGSGIAIANVLLPSILKRDFPQHVAKLTACYALVMIAAAGLISVIAIPADHMLGGGWRTSLATIALFPIGAALLWFTQIHHEAARKPVGKSALYGSLVWKSALAWQIAAYLGLTCFIHFAAIAWLPSILQDANYSGAYAGALHGWMQIAGAVPALVLMPMLPSMRNQRAVAALSPALGAVGLVGLLMLPSWAPFWITAFGIGLGSALILSLAFVGLRAGNPHIAATLSGMSQSLGYLFASVGPTLFGFLHELYGNWRPPLIGCTLLCLVMSVLGLSVGRSVHIEAK